MNNKQVGIKEQIKAAVSKTEVEILLRTARNFKYIHPSTLRKCEKEANIRIAKLGAVK